VAPIISANVSWLIFGLMGCQLPSFLECEAERKGRETLPCWIEQLVDQVSFNSAVARQIYAQNISENFTAAFAARLVTVFRLMSGLSLQTW